MKNYLTLLCLSSIQDVSTRLHTFVNCLEYGAVSSIPENLSGFNVVSKWTSSKEGSKISVSVVCHRPDGSEDILGSIEDIQSTKGIITFSIGIQSFEVRDFGEHNFQIKIQEEGGDCYFGHNYPIFISKLEEVS